MLWPKEAANEDCFKMGMILATASLCSTIWGQTAWPEFMPSLHPGLSTSSVPAVMPKDITIEPPLADVPSDKARWSGRWRGWACRDQVCETRLVVEKVVADGATILYASSSAEQKPFIEHVEAKFVGDELQGTRIDGGKLHYRFRKRGDIEFFFQSDSGWSAGILSREK